MNPPNTTGVSDFDSYAADYDLALGKGIAVSGEDKMYFALGRIRWLKDRLKQQRFQPSSALDFGTGTGTSAPVLRDELGAETVLGVDVSAASLDAARRLHGAAHFQLLCDYRPEARFDLAFCNGVFHHIPLADRAAALRCVYDSLRPGGYFAFWENNPWNPATRYVMSRIPFDRDALTLTPLESRRILRASGFEVLRTDFLFIFPRVLRWLRWSEKYVAHLPLGTQYEILCRKPTVGPRDSPRL
jgi:SAM-dependent methyltransferase